MSSARLTEFTVETAPAFIEIAPIAFLAQGALVNSTATNSTTDEVARLTRELQEAKEALEKSKEQQEKIKMEKDQEIQELKKRNFALFGVLAETRKAAAIEQTRAQEIMEAQVQTIQSLTSILQAKQANLDKAQGDLKALTSQMTSCKKQIEMLQEQLQGCNTKRAYYKNGCKAQKAFIGRQTIELEALRASKGLQKDALQIQRFLSQEHTRVLGSKLQHSVQVMDELERLHTLLALSVERGDAAEQQVREMNWRKRQEKTKKASRRLDFGKVEEKKREIATEEPDQLPAEPPLEKMPNFLLNV